MRCPSFLNRRAQASRIKDALCRQAATHAVVRAIERDRLLLQQKVQSLSGQLSDLTTVELLGAEKTFRLVRRLVTSAPSKIEDAPLCGARHLDWQVCDSELEAHRGYLRMDDDYVRVLTLKELPGETRPLILNGLLDIRRTSMSSPNGTP